MSQRKISATEIAGDIRQGMSNADLMRKHHVSSEGLHGLFKKLVAAGILNQSEIMQRFQSSEAFKCPACGTAQSSKFDECPKCGIVVSKFHAARKRVSKEIEQQDTKETRQGDPKNGREETKEKQVTDKRRIITAGWVFSWMFGVLFLFIGLGSLIESPLAGVSLVAISLLLLPPVRNFAHSKTNKEISVKARAVSIFVLFIAFGIFVGQDQDKKTHKLAAQQAKEKAAQAAQVRQENIDHFNASRDQIISSVKAALLAKEYQSVISQSSKYLVSGDEELKQINLLAKTELAEIQRAEKTEKLLAELKTIPTEKYEKNKNLYQHLVNLHPGNGTYKNKVSFYSGKIKEAKQKQLAAEARKKQIERQFSPWDGSHDNLERVIKKAMNDPDSYEHDETVYWDMGNYLVVRTTYRGKNAFGGVVRNFVKAKVSLDGQILQILDQT